MTEKNKVTIKNIEKISELKKFTIRKRILEKENKKETKAEYQQVLQKVIELEKEMEIPFKKETFNEILDKKVIPFSPGNLNGNQIEILRKNKELDSRYYKKLEQIEKFYNERKSITEFEKATKEYIKIWMQIK